MPIKVKRKEGETSSSLIFRFTKRVQHSGVLKESKKRRFHSRSQNRTKRLVSALYRERKKAEMEKMRKMGLL
ncbi:hypothetical protein A3A20_00885 [Candidatus Wolfebacteria bacterium RIFCSPLOWO2_01_FULL_45_19]|uniref:30S ribosomal protein S21 n=1 Tax=Candidatus Wolfebacteria bacterium RIFCSPLOWO2_01_FULL_45_19 TaxID=1802557 RepID=A0A1F8DPU7_9BACT|nr:MAG: hypothetical protein UX23_C0011G0006 [Parcubacteria group bacterium GW2011_GWB1_45_9]OGM90647.1 MAG: hypothetical protein A3A20_00885 [Candidatus Wolfebacteria bacterium RIFCSPLOWO2_01_FULL_45_19]